MKPSALRIERMLEKIEAKLVPPERKCLCAIIHERDDEAEAKEKTDEEREVGNKARTRLIVGALLRKWVLAKEIVS